MAFGGVEIGSMKPKDAPKVAAIAGITGSTPAAMASGTTIGTVTAAAAVLLVVSEMRMASNTAMAVMTRALDTPNILLRPEPIVSARPELPSMPPKIMPQPNNMMVPQSILAASDQSRVYCSFLDSTGSEPI